MDYHLISASLIYFFFSFFFFFFFLAALARRAEISPRFRLVRHRRLGVNVLNAATVTRWPDVQSDGERPVGPDTATREVTLLLLFKCEADWTECIRHNASYLICLINNSFLFCF